MKTLVKKPVFIVVAALALVGIGFWIYQLIAGLGITGMNNANSWGLYIIMFMFFVGLSAGGLIVASAASVFNVKDYKKVALPAVILSTACICVAGIFILFDLGGIQRILGMIISPNFASPLLWDMCVILLYLIVNVFYLVFLTSKKAGADRKVAIISRFALPIAILVHSVTAWIFGLQIAKEAWYSAIMAPLFVASAMDSGLALLIMVLGGMNKTGRFKTDPKLISSLAGLLAVCIAIDAFFVGCEVLTMAYPGAGGAETLGIMAFGATAPFFWFEVLVGLFVPFLILVFAKNRQGMTLVMVASACVVLGVLAKRIWLLLTAFVMPNVEGAPGVSLGTTAAQQGGVDMFTVLGSYVPTAPEIVIAVGIICIGVTIFMVLAEMLLPDDKSIESDAISTAAPASAIS